MSPSRRCARTVRTSSCSTCRMPRVDGWGVLEHVRTMERSAAGGPRQRHARGASARPPQPLRHRLRVQAVRHQPSAPDLCGRDRRPPLIPASGIRREARKTFLVETTLLSETGIPLGKGQLRSAQPRRLPRRGRGGLRAGRSQVRVAFRLPGRDEPLRLVGRVRWRTEFTLGRRDRRRHRAGPGPAPAAHRRHRRRRA